MKSLNGTRTAANLAAAIAGETKAHASYVRFAAKAKEEGHDAVAYYFETTAVNEQEHAKIWQKFLGAAGPDKEAKNTDQIKVGTSKDNLQAAINGESYENSEMYPSFANAAREEGFDAIAKLFDQVSEIEKTHAEYFKGLLDKLRTPTVASSTTSRSAWKCATCGFLVANEPAACPVCNSQSFRLFSF